MTTLSRVLGLARDIVLAGFIGASPAADAFYVAFKIPNFLRRLFAEGAFSQAFIPVLADYKAEGSIAAVKGARLVAACGRRPKPTKAFAEKFGGDSVDEMARNVRGYLDNLAIR